MFSQLIGHRWADCFQFLEMPPHLPQFAASRINALEIESLDPLDSKV